MIISSPANKGKDMMFYVNDGSGRRHAVDFDAEYRLIWFAGADTPQQVPPMWDTNCYQFSHGGALYQKACRRVWEWQEARA